MKRRMIVLCAVLVAMTVLSTTAFAIDEAEVNAAINASSKEAVSGNLLIWFLCAVGFLKISQKIDSFMSGLGINVGNTGSSMLTEMLLAGRGVGAAATVFGGVVGGAVNNATSTAYNSSKAFTGGGNSVISIAKRAVGNTAAAGATQRGGGISGAIGGAMFASSLNNGGRLATNVIGAVATGNYSKVGSITGEKASQALTSYLGYADAAPNAANPQPEPVVDQSGDVISVDGGSTASAVLGGKTIASSPQAQQPPSFRDVEIGGGRITGFETPAGGGEERQFAMYNASQYMAPSGDYETVQTTDGESWYKQYAQPTVEKTPYEESGQIKYDEQIVDQMPQVPKRKDRI